MWEKVESNRETFRAEIRNLNILKFDRAAEMSQVAGFYVCRHMSDHILQYATTYQS